ncbi:WD40 repeat domain-containing protein [Dactylosporangium sp. NPDC050588]|uniref:WD40 repeat domain-containing protein n=1 Tax=Dactylosporangium sp. NPDC050588 TaxID=3157211 RepID=UPI003405D1EA
MTNPYVGPRALQDGEPIYGRDGELDQLLDRVLARRIVLMYAPSGAGKTSLVQAGLIPRLRDEDFVIHPVVRVVSPLAGAEATNPFIAGAVASIDPAADVSPGGFAAHLDRLRTDDRLEFLVFDQFEELIRDAGRPQQIVEFMTDVGAALRDQRRWALFVMREDHIAALDPFLPHIPTQLSARFRLDYLSRSGAVRAVREPAELRGVDFTDEAAEFILDDLARERADSGAGERIGSRVEPVHLQVVCAKLWDRLPPGATRLDLAHVREHGNVNDALGDFYDEGLLRVTQLTGVDEHALRNWFGTELITPDGFRAQVQHGPAGDPAEATVQHLQDGHLIRAERQRGTVWYELTHDRLVKPVRERNTRWSAALRRRTIRVQSIIAALAFLLVASIGVIVVVSRQAQVEAQTDARSATVARLLLEARSARPAQPALALRLGVAAMSLNPDAQTRAALTDTLAANRLVATLTTGHGATPVAAVSPDGRLLVTGSADSTAVLWDVHDPAAARVLSVIDSGRGTLVDAAAFSADSATVVLAGSLDGTVSRWDVTDPALPRAVTTGGLGAGGTVDVAALAAGGRLLLTGTSGPAAALWDVTAAPTRTATLPTTGADVTAVAVSEGTAAVGTADGTVDLWTVTDPIRPRRTATLTAAAPGPVRSLALAPDRGHIAVGGIDGGTAVWDITDPVRPVRGATLRGHTQPVTAAAFSPDGRSLLTGSADQTAVQWTVTTGGATFAARLGNHTDGVSAVAFAPGGGIAVTADGDNALNLWRTAAPGPTPRGPLDGHRGAVVSAAFSADGRRLATAGDDRTVQVWAVARGEAPRRLATLPARPAAVVAVAFSPDASSLTVLDAAGTASQWDPGDPRAPVRSGTLAAAAPIVAAALTVDSDRTTLVASVGATQPAVVTVWTPFDAPRQLTTVSAGALTVAADGDLNRLVVGTAGTAQLWGTADITGPGLAGTLSGRGGSVERVALAADGRLALTASSVDGSATLWSLADPARPAPLLDLDAGITAAGFDAGSRKLAVGGAGTVTVWSVDPRYPPSALGAAGNGAAVSAVALSPDGLSLVIGAADGTVSLWDNTPLDAVVADPVAAACAVVTRGLNAGEWSRHVQGLTYRETCAH